MNTLSIYNSPSILRSPPVYNVGMKKFPNNIRHYRELRGISQEQLGNAVGKTKDTISKWERGERKLKMEEAKKLAGKLGVSLGQLADDIEAPAFDIDEDLMQKAAEAIQKAAVSQGKKLTLAYAMTYTVMLYKYIMEYRRKGDGIEPNEAIAALILERVA